MVSAYLREQFCKGRTAKPTNDPNRVAVLDGLELRKMLEEETDPKRALKLSGYRIEGNLHLNERTLDFLISFSDCEIDCDVRFTRSNVRWLLFDRCKFSKYVSLSNAEITSDLAFAGGTAINGNLALDGVRINGKLDARGLRIFNVDQRDPALDLTGAHIKGDVLLSQDPELAEGRATSLVGGPLRADGAKIGGDFNLSRLSINLPRTLWDDEITGEKNPALSCKDAEIDDDLNAYGLVTNSYCVLVGSRIGGALSFTGCTLQHGKDREGRSIAANRIRVGGPVYVNKMKDLWGSVALNHAHIAGELDLRMLAINSQHVADIELEQAQIGGDVIITGDPGNRARRMRGRIVMTNAAVAGAFKIITTTLCGSRGIFVRAGGAKIDGDVEIDDCDLSGTLDFSDVRIGGDFEITASNIESIDGENVNACLNLSKATIKGAVVLGDGQQPKVPDGETNVFRGWVSLADARIGGSFRAGALTLDWPTARDKTVLDLRALSVGDDLTVERCRLTGPLDAERLTARAVTIHDCAIEPLADKTAQMTMLNLSRSEVQGKIALLVRETADDRVLGGVSLTGATCQEFEDDDAFWSTTANNAYDGFVYRRLGARASKKLGPRKRWLAKQGDKDFHPQPYNQLSTVLRAMGYTSASLRIAQRAEIVSRGRYWWRPDRLLLQLPHRIFGMFGGYGYRLDFAMGWLALFFALCLLITDEGWRAGAYAPTDLDAQTSRAWQSCIEDPGDRTVAQCWSSTPSGEDGGGLEYERFSSIAYAVDVIVPILDLDKEDRWTVGSSVRQLSDDGWIAWALRRLGELGVPISAWRPDMASVARTAEPIFTVLGWLLSAFIAAGLSRSVLRG